MPIFNDTILTEKGYELANKSANGQASFTITKAVASPVILRDKSESELKQLASLDREFIGRIVEKNNVDGKKTAIKTNFSNELVPDGYTANTVGLYARDNNGNEFLYSVTTSNIGQVIPEQSNSVFSGFELSIYIIVGNVERMKVELSPGGDASVDYVDKMVSETKDVLLEKIEEVKDSVKNDIKPEIDKKATIEEVNKKVNTEDFNKALNDKVKGVSMYRDVFKGDALTLKDYPAGRYWANGGVTNAPINSVGGWGTFDVIKTNPYDTTIIANFNDVISYNNFTNNSWSGWKYIATSNDLDKTYQNAVNTAKAYTDNNPTYKMTTSEEDALNQANNSTKAGLFLYPTPEDKSKIAIAKRVLGIYSYGIGNVPTVAIDLINPDSSMYTFDNVYATYNPNINRAYLHGKITLKKDVQANTDLFRFNIGQLSKNDINYSWLNSQYFGIDTDAHRDNIVAKTNGFVSTGGQYTLDGCDITLKYDGSLKPKIEIPTNLRAGTVVLQDGDDLNSSKFSVTQNYLYYAPKGAKIGNVPTKDEGYYIEVVWDTNNAYPFAQNALGYTSRNHWARNGNSKEWSNFNGFGFIRGSLIYTV